MLESIEQIQSLANVQPNLVTNSSEDQNASVTIDKRQLTNLLASLTGKVTTIGQLGQNWEHLCLSINDSLSQSIDKSSTLNHKLKHMKKE